MIRGSDNLASATINEDNPQSVVERRRGETDRCRAADRRRTPSHHIAGRGPVARSRRGNSAFPYPGLSGHFAIVRRHHLPDVWSRILKSGMNLAPQLASFSQPIASECIRAIDEPVKIGIESIGLVFRF